MCLWFCSKASILQIHYHHVLHKCIGFFSLCCEWKWIWVLVFTIKTYPGILIIMRICFSRRTLKFFIFIFYRLYDTITICYHAFYLQLIYGTFLADFFQVMLCVSFRCPSSRSCSTAGYFVLLFILPMFSLNFASNLQCGMSLRV